MSGGDVVLASAAYLGLLFAIAFAVDRRGSAVLPRALPQSWIFALSLAVYGTTWTFFGSVGQAATSGMSFIPINLGPILVFMLAQPFLRKLVGVSRHQHVTSLADFISARYGGHQSLAALVTLVVLIGVVPYISLQLKAVASTFDTLTSPMALAASPAPLAPPTLLTDTALHVALLMAGFVMAFATRRVDASEQHRGMVTTIAFESLVKLAALVAVGLFVTYGLHDGFADLIGRAAASPSTAHLVDLGSQLQSPQFWSIAALSAMVIFCLPRQFQVMVVENTQAEHLRTAAWLFPLYLVLLNLFILPIALAGALTPALQGTSPDTFVLTLPLLHEAPWLALFAFIGGLSAATSMIIVETIALATMVGNTLVLPALLRGRRLDRSDTSSAVPLVKWVRRAAILGILLLAYAYVRLTGDAFALTGIGLVSFVAVAQFAPAIVLGLYWERAHRNGVHWGLLAGFALWTYTLLLPSFAASGWLPGSFVTDGAFGIALLKPHALFGLDGLDRITHGLLWSLGTNLMLFLSISLVSSTDKEAGRRFRAAPGVTPHGEFTARIEWADLERVLARFLGSKAARNALTTHAQARGLTADPCRLADDEAVAYVERMLAGALGSSLARVVMAALTRERQRSMAGMMNLLSEASEQIEMQWERLREAVQNVNQGVAMFDGKLGLVVWNHRLLDIVGLPPALAAVGTPLPKLIEGCDNEALRTCMRHDLTAAPCTTEHVQADGRVIELYRKALAGGGLIATFTDVTSRKQVEQALQTAKESLEQEVAERTAELVRQEKMAALGGLVAGVAHEINTPVGIAITASSFLRERAREFADRYAAGQMKRSDLETFLATLQESLAALDANLARAAGMVRSFKQVAVDQSSDARRRFRVAEYVTEIFDSLRPQLKHTPHTVRIDCPPELEVDSFPGAWSQILTNLVVNSLQHGLSMEKPGEISVAVERLPEAVRVTYRDDGRGMPPELARRIFEPFFTTRRSEGGSGLGMHIVFNLVTQRLGGMITCTTSPGKGISFILTLPLGEDKPDG